MSRRGDCPLVEVEYMVLSFVKHTPTIDVTTDSRRESILATSAKTPLTNIWHCIRPHFPAGAMLGIWHAQRTMYLETQVEGVGCIRR